MSATHRPLARAQGVTRRFGDFVAVDQVDIQVAPSEVVGLLGANGAGKTTLIRMLLGLLRPSDGEVALFGQAPSRTTRRRLGYVPQGLGLYEDLTAAENLAFRRAVFGHPDGDQPAPAGTDAQLRRTQVGDTLVGQLPLGTQRRLAFATALRHRPDLLVLDEPTSGVDALARARLWETIRGAAEAGAGVLVTTHHMEEAEECDRLVVMARGRVVAQGTVPEIVGDATVTTVDTPGAGWARSFDALERAGLPVALVGRSLRVPGADRAEVEQALGPERDGARIGEAPATLDEAFFHLTTQAGDGSGP